MITRPLIELPLLAAIWGGSFLFMKVGVPEFGAVGFMAVRTFVAAVMLLGLLAMKKQLKSLLPDARNLFIVGIFSTAVPFVLFGWATLTLTVGSTSVLNGATPMFGAIVGYLWLKDKLTKWQVLGLAIGFIGIYVLMFDKLSMPQSNVLMPTLAVLLASCCYGISANYTKKYLSHLKPLTLAAGCQISATVMLVPVSLFFLPEEIPSIAAINSALIIGLLCTGFAYIVFFRLITHMGPTKAISVTYLIPAFGIFWGAIFLSETVTSMMLAGCCLILLGVALTTGAIKGFSLNKTT